jgi:exopolysaccharide biosynthesis polyprenyl glycosylphosphotransferase
LSVRIDLTTSAESPGTGADALTDPSVRVWKPMRAARYRAIGLMLLGADVLCLAGSLLGPYMMAAPPSFGTYLLVLFAGVPVWWASFAAFGLYAPGRFSASDEYRRAVAACATGVILVAAASAWLGSSIPSAWLAPTWLTALGLELLARRGGRAFLSRWRSRGRVALPTLVLGTNDEARRLAQTLATPGSGFAPLGYLARARPFVSPDGFPVIGEMNDLREVVRNSGAECLFVASSAVSAQDVARAAEVARVEGAELRVSTVLPAVLGSRVAVSSDGAGSSLYLHFPRLARTQSVLKRGLDVGLGGLVLLLTLPLLIVVAAAIRFTSSGPVIFRQERMTKGMRSFIMYKFRTMAPPRAGGEVDEDGDRSAPFFKLREDPRLTRVGRILRKLSLDELPQLVNVIRGDMSLVGPRPLPVEQVLANEQLLLSRHEVRPGLTGWWQIHGRSTVDPREAVRLDRFYIENQSLTLDLYILWRTLGAVVSRRGAY